MFCRMKHPQKPKTWVDRDKQKEYWCNAQRRCRMRKRVKERNSVQGGAIEEQESVTVGEEEGQAEVHIGEKNVKAKRRGRQVQKFNFQTARKEKQREYWRIKKQKSRQKKRKEQRASIEGETDGSKMSDRDEETKNQTEVNGASTGRNKIEEEKSTCDVVQKKRKRGRPKKAPEEGIQSISVEEELERQSEDNIILNSVGGGRDRAKDKTTTAVVEEKRNRGRPKNIAKRREEDIRSNSVVEGVERVSVDMEGIRESDENKTLPVESVGGGSKDVGEEK